MAQPDPIHNGPTTAAVPSLYTGKGQPSRMTDALLALCAPLGMAVFFYGLRALLLCLTGMLAAVACEYAFTKSFRLPTSVWDCSALVTGMLVALLCPAAAPYWLPALGAAFAVLVAKMPFGGLGKNWLNPAASGWLLMAAFFPGVLFSYSDLKTPSFLPLSFSLDFAPSISLSSALRRGYVPAGTLVNLLTGRISGPMGSSAALVILAAALFLSYRRAASLWISGSFLLTCAAVSFLFPRATNSGAVSVLYELSSGSLLFCAVFMATDPTTSPNPRLARILYGIGCGLLTMLLRHMGLFEQCAPVAILGMNLSAPLLDRMVFPQQSAPLPAG